jgi:hypothetical protein
MMINLKIIIYLGMRLKKTKHIIIKKRLCFTLKHQVIISFLGNNNYKKYGYISQ